MNGGGLVYLARTRAGLTQRELGERAGIAQNAIARIEKGRVRTSFETVRDLIRLLRLKHKAGDRVEIQVYRQKRQLTLTITLGERPSG